MRTATSIAVITVRVFRRNVGNIRLRYAETATPLATIITAIRRVVLRRRIAIADHYDITIAVPTNALPTAMPAATARTTSVVAGIIAARTIYVSTKERIKQIAHSILSPSCVFEKTLIL